MDKPKKVMCPREGCQGIIAYIYGERLTSVKRSKQLTETVGRDYVLISTCPFKECHTRTSIVCQDGKIRLDNLKIMKEEEDPKPENEEIKEEPKKEEKKDETEEK
jgi:hypothetical protein